MGVLKAIEAVSVLVHKPRGVVQEITVFVIPARFEGRFRRRFRGLSGHFSGVLAQHPFRGRSARRTLVGRTHRGQLRSGSRPRRPIKAFVKQNARFEKRVLFSLFSFFFRSQCSKKGLDSKSVWISEMLAAVVTQVSPCRESLFSFEVLICKSVSAECQYSMRSIARNGEEKRPAINYWGANKYYRIVQYSVRARRKKIEAAFGREELSV